MVTDKKVNEIYNTPKYEEILSYYWNNGTHQIQDPKPIVDNIRKPQLESHEPPREQYSHEDSV